MNAKIALVLLTLLALGVAAAPVATADPTCQDLNGNGSACVDGTNADVVFDNGIVHSEVHVHIS